VSGRSSDQAIIRLTRDGFTNIQTEEAFSPTVLAGFVIETNPAAGQVVPTEATITVIVSKGPEPVNVPDLSGMSQGQAQSALNGVGLTLVVSSDTIPVPLNSGLVGNVAEQSPGAGQEVEVGTQVVVKLGVVQKVAVPNFIGELVADAQAQAIAVGLDVDIVGSVTTTNQALDGTVESQSSPPGSSVDEGTIIDITVYVYQAPPPTTTP
jgi:serine/threonine-protein kinase